MLDRWRRELELNARMEHAVGQRFTVSFEGPEESDLAALAIESLDRAFWRIGEVFSVYPNRPIPVILYSAEQFRDITRSPSWAAGAFDGTIRVPMRGALEQPDELDRVLAHEFTHALIQVLAPRGVPAWLNEGLAAALERSEPRRTDSEAGMAMPLGALQTGFGRLTGAQAAAAYATSARAARRLLDEAGGVAVANLLRDVGEGAAFDAAFLHRIQRTLADFEATLF
jgi:hypothetical protein